MKWLVVLALAAGCTGFDALPRNICGNGLVEPGEDCDSSDATCVRCAVACTRDSECPSSAYTCGTDGACHAPGGALAEPVPAGSFLVDQFAISDVDHDGAGDVVGFSKTSIEVRHGDPAGQLARSTTLFTPSESGPPALGDLDDDGVLDVTLATPDGLVAYTSTFGDLSPVDVQSAITGGNGEKLDFHLLFQVASGTLGAFIASGGHMFIAAVEFFDPSRTAVEAPCGARLGLVATGGFSTDTLDVYQVNRDTDIATDVVVSMVLGTASGPRLCVMSIHKDNVLAAPVLTDITPPGAVAPAKKPLLADLNTNGDRCPGLVNVDGGARALRYWDGAPTTGHCMLKAASAATGDPVLAISDASATAAIVGRIPVDPAVPSVVGDALVASDGVYALIPLLGKWTPLYRTTRQLARVASADLDGDGAIDAVLSATGEDDLDILYRSVSPPGFQLLRLDTASEATSITLGDYDGNGVGDIAYTEAAGSHERMLISYGTHDHPLPPVQVGAFRSIAAISRLAIPDSVDQLSLAGDLAVLQPPVNGTSTLTLLHGSPNRTMMPYFDPRTSPAAAATGVMRNTVIGRFVESAGSSEHRDIVALAADTGDSGVRAFVVAGTDIGLDGTQTDGMVVPGLANCATSGAGLCIANATLFAWPVSASRDVVIAIDRQASPHVGVVDPWSGSLALVPAPAMMNAIPANATLAQIHAADVDGDGVPELVAAFAPGTAADRGAILVCHVTDGVPAHCDDLVPAIVAAFPAVHACSDAAPGQLTYRGPLSTTGAGTDLIVLCQDDGSTLFRVTIAASGTTVAPLAHATTPLGALRVGDVTGDGVPDVVALAGTAGAQALVVYPQCTSENLATCAPGAAIGAAP